MEPIGRGVGCRDHGLTLAVTQPVVEKLTEEAGLATEAAARIAAGKLPMSGPQPCGVVHGCDPTGCRLLRHRAVAVDAGHPKPVLLGQIRIGEPRHVGGRIIDSLAVRGGVQCLARLDGDAERVSRTIGSTYMLCLATLVPCHPVLNEKVL